MRRTLLLAVALGSLGAACGGPEDVTIHNFCESVTGGGIVAGQSAVPAEHLGDAWTPLEVEEDGSGRCTPDFTVPADTFHWDCRTEGNRSCS